MRSGDKMRIALLDGYNLMHRARFGMKNGDMHIVFNFFRSLRPIIAEINPDKIYLVLEGVPTHRIEADASYKANRVIEEGTPQAVEMAEFRRQKKIILEALKHFPITLAKHPALECDDTIASLCVDVHKDDDCTVVSTDTDFIQLLDTTGRVKLFNPVKKEYVAAAPYDYVMWKALRGDKTDNVPRVDGMTDAKAEKTLADPTKFQALINDPHLRTQFDRNLKLIRFKTGLHDGINYVHPAPNLDEARQVFRGFKFFSMVNDTAWKNFSKTFLGLL
jgi:DNA polymerase-1